MAALTPAALRRQLASGEMGRLYLLTGADTTEKVALVTELTGTLEEELRAFNLDRLYGGDVDVARLVECASTLPMLAARRIVVVLEAEKLLMPKRESQAADEAQAQLESFLAAPPAHATVVFVCTEAPDMRRRAVKRLMSEAQVVDCAGTASGGEAEAWVKVQAARSGVRLDPGAVRALVARAGGQMARLRAGFDRVTLYALDAPVITADDVHAAVPAAPDAQVNFGIANAIESGDAAAALKQLALALDGGAAPFFVMGQIRMAAEKLPAPRLPAAIEAVFRTDLALKSSGGEPRVLLERLVVQLSGTRRAPGPRAPGRPPFQRR